MVIALKCVFMLDFKSDQIAICVHHDISLIANILNVMVIQVSVAGLASCWAWKKPRREDMISITQSLQAQAVHNTRRNEKRE